MKKKYLALPLLLLCFSLPIHAQDSPLQDLVGDQFNFKITESADYTNYLDDSILITVGSSLERSFSIQNVGSNTTNGVWMTGIEQVSIDNLVKIGALKNSGFQANSTPVKEGIVRPFNLTVFPTANYTSHISLSPLPFIKDHQLNTTLIDNSTVYTPLIRTMPVFFVLSPDDYMRSNVGYFNQYLDKISNAVDAESSVTLDNSGFSFTTTGTMPDYHEFTYYKKNVSSVLDLNTLDFDGSVSFDYSNNGVIRNFNIRYQISYDGTEIMDYQYSLTVRTGTGGNFNVGEPSSLPIFIILIAIDVITILIILLRDRSAKE